MDSFLGRWQGRGERVIALPAIRHAAAIAATLVTPRGRLTPTSHLSHASPR